MTLDRRGDADPPRLTPTEIMIRIADLPEQTRHALLATMQDWVGVQKTEAETSRIQAKAELVRAKTAWWQEVTAAISAYLICALALAGVVVLAMVALRSLDLVDPSRHMYIVTPTVVGVLGVLAAVIRALTRR